MGDMKAAIMDAAERRMRAGGFFGFSYRDIAADVGIKSSSVHHHFDFATKENLAAAVTRRWADHTSTVINTELVRDPDQLSVWARTFRGTAFTEPHMCPCVVLGASSRDLPAPVAEAVRQLFQMCLDKFVAGGLSQNKASEFLSTLVGAMVVANSLGDATQ
jgi:TetR/AcrR family transcriptional regulator, transcriptional repressor for nem operon